MKRNGARGRDTSFPSGRRRRGSGNPKQTKKGLAVAAELQPYGSVAEEEACGTAAAPDGRSGVCSPSALPSGIQEKKNVEI